MSLLTNSNTIHLYNRWISPWYESTNIYSNLIYTDLYIFELVNGIYYQLNIPTSIPFYKELNYNQLVVRVNAHLFRKRKQKRSSLFYCNKTNFYYNYKKIMFLLHKTLFQKKQYKNKFNKKLINNKYINGKKHYLYVNKLFFVNKKQFINIRKSSVNFSKNMYLLKHFLVYKSNSKYIRKLSNKKLYKKNILNILLKYKKLINFNYTKKRFYQKNKLHLTRKKKKYKRIFGRKKNKLKLKRKNKRLVFVSKFKKNKFKRKMLRFIKFKKKNNKTDIFTRKKNIIKLLNSGKKKNKFKRLNKKNKKKYLKLLKIKEKNLKKININKIKNRIKLLTISKKKKRNKKYRKNKNVFNLNLFVFVMFYKKLLNWYYMLLVKLFVIAKLFGNKIIFINSNINNNNNNFYSLKNKIFNYNCYFNLTIYKVTCNFYKKLYWFNNYYFFILLNHLRYKLMHTINSYLGVNILYLPYYKKKFFNIQDAKLVNDYIKIKLQSKRSIIKIMRKLVKIHSFQRYKMRNRNMRYYKKFLFFRRKLNKKLKFNKYFLKKQKYFNIANLRYFFRRKMKKFYLKKNKLRKKLNKWKHKFKYFNYKHYPLVGIRIECNGPSKKGRRTTMITYNEWVNYYKLPGKMPYTTQMADVHYWQNYARTKRAAIGIKIWLFFNTLLYGFKIKKQKNIKVKQ